VARKGGFLAPAWDIFLLWTPKENTSYRHPGPERNC